MNMKVLCICFFTVLFLAVAPTGQEPPGISAFENDSHPHFEPAYTPHDPIVVRDDGDLAAFPGNGTAVNPYRIEGYNITSDGVCIDIQDTTAHYLITDCLISASGSSSSDGIYIESAPNGTIQECIVERHQAGLSMQDSVDCSIVNNTFRDNSGNGFYSYGCGNLLVKNNTAVDNDFGLYLGMENSIVQNNSLYNNRMGLYMGGTGVTVIENEAKNNSQYGFYLGLVSSNFTHNMAMENQVGIRINELELESRISMNEVRDNDETGIYSQGYIIDSEICNNTIENHKYGFFLEGLHLGHFENISFTGNTLCNNGLYLYYVPLRDLFASVDGTTVNGKPLGYLRDLNDTVVDGRLYGQIVLFDCTHTVVTHGHYVNATQGVKMHSCTNCTIRDVISEENSGDGFFISSSDNVTLWNNTARYGFGSGFYLRDSDDCSLTNNTAFMIAGHGFRLHRSQNLTIQDNLADSSLASGFILTGYSHDRLASPTLIDNTARNNTANGFHMDHCESSHLMRNTAECNDESGFYIRYAVNLNSTENCATENKRDGFYFLDSVGGYLHENDAISNSRSGFNLTDSDIWSLTGNTATENTLHGFSVENAADYTLEYNVANENHIGFRLDALFNSSLEQNQADSNLAHGFDFPLSENLTLVGNNATYSGISGFHLPSSANCTVMKSTVIHNSLGVELDTASVTNLFYMNNIGYNTFFNAYDEGESTTWDNGTHGNCWSDYPGSGFYLIQGAGGAVDRYPCVLDLYAPSTNHPEDVTYEYGSEGNSITWIVSEIHPDSYEIYRNSSLLVSSPLHESNITVDVDGLDLGVWNFTLLVSDTYGNSTTDTVMVTVVDTSAPEIDGIPNIFYELGSTGNIVTWDPTDLSPESYKIYLDGSMIATASWDGSPINLNIDGLPVGTYEYEIVVTDSSENVASDTLLVTVSDTTNPELSSPSDVVYELGSTGNRIHWNATELDPDHYDILRNGSIVDHVSWNGGEINHSIDGLSVGFYNLTIVAYDASGNSAADTVFVEVVDTVAPSIDRPADIEYVAGSTGHEISWTVSDLGASFYQILRNGEVLVDAAWDGSPIVVNVDFLIPGIYNYTLVVADEGGNLASDSVLVTVSESTTTTTTTTAPTTTSTTTTAPEGQGMALLGIGIGSFVGGAAFVLILLVLRDKFGSQLRLPWMGTD